MMIRHGAVVMVADGAKFVLLRNVGTPGSVNLVVLDGGEQDNPATAEQGSERPGRVFASAGTARSAVGQTDWHQLGEDRFAEGLCDMLGKLVEEGHAEELIVVAPPKSLAALRKAMNDKVAALVVAEIAKDLTNHPVPRIAELLAREDA